MHNWLEHPASPTAPVELLFALRHPAEGLLTLRELIANVSDPFHERYGSYLTADELRSIVSPPAAASTAVLNWLRPHGEARLVRTGDFIHFQSSAANTTRLLGEPELRSFSHPAVSHPIVRATRTPTVPTDVAPHIELVRGLYDFPQPRRRHRRASPAAPLVEVAAAVTASPCSFAFFDFPTIVAAGGGVLNATLSWQCTGGGGGGGGGGAAAVDHFALTLTQGGKQLTARASGAGDACGTPAWAGGNPVCQLGWEVPGLVDYARADGLRVVPVFRGGGGGATLEHSHPIVPTPWATPAKLRELYNVPAPAMRRSGDGGDDEASVGATAPRNGSMAVLEFGGSFDPKDAALFAKLHGEPPPNVTVRGHNNPANPDTENTMDVQMMAAMGAGVPLAYWGYSFDKWLLDWAADVSDDPSPPLVWSLSFGEPEATADAAELTRTETELAKMAARGLTIVSTSGDWGTSDNVNCSRFFADFPSSSPHTTSAGATIITAAAVVSVASVGAGRVEVVVVARRAATDGARRRARPRTAAPSRRAAASRRSGPRRPGRPALWPATSNASTPRKASSSMRLGAATTTWRVIGGRLSPCGVGGGTSASGPIIGGLLALANAARIDAGRPPLGLVNALLYAAPPSAFNAVGSDRGTNSNQCASEPGYECCAHGLREAAGWDPLTGLGSIDFGQLLKAVRLAKPEGGARAVTREVEEPEQA